MERGDCAMSDEAAASNGSAENTQENTTTTITTEELEKLRKMAEEREQFVDAAARAEFENFQKRNQRDREMDRKYGFGPLAMDLLPILDNLDRAVYAARQAGDNGPLVQGVAMVVTQFLELLKRHGITRLDCEGKPFDPNLHQAVMQKPTSEVAPNKIVQVVEQGFMNQDRVLRPAKVVVATKD
jgi:molecular chaperone GrpE